MPRKKKEVEEEEEEEPQRVYVYAKGHKRFRDITKRTIIAVHKAVALIMRDICKDLLPRLWGTPPLSYNLCLAIILKELLDSLEEELDRREAERIAKTKEVLRYIARQQKSLSVEAAEEVRAIEAMRELQKERKKRKKEGRRIIPPPP
jgi:hypothetical protein